jgi:hypothetical protein
LVSKHDLTSHHEEGLMVTEEAKIVATEIDVEEIGVEATLGEEAEAAGIITVMAIEGPGGDKLESKNNRA